MSKHTYVFFIRKNETHAFLCMYQIQQSLSSFRWNTKPIATRRYIMSRCYNDRVQHDEDNRVFYIYHLSRYHTKSYYHFGSSLDITTKELDLAKVYPYYKKIYDIPVGRMTASQAAFETFIKPHKTQCPLNTLSDIFCLEDHDEIHAILIRAEELFNRND